MPKQIIAAGGLVTNPEKQILWIFRRGFWDLPKGKLDEGETIQTCAVREVEEETGLVNIQLHELLNFTNHTYFDNYLKEEVVTRTYWFRMNINSLQQGVPQTNEDIEGIEWNTLENSAHCLSHTYENIREVITAYTKKMRSF